MANKVNGTENQGMTEVKGIETPFNNEVSKAAAPAISPEVETAPITEEVLLPVLSQYSNVPKISTKAAAAHIETLIKMTEFIGAESKNLDAFANMELTVVGAVKHPATVRSRETGELESVNRVVILLEDGTTIGAVSVAVENFFDTLIFPAFGMGRWQDANGNNIKFIMKATPVATSSGGRSYNLRVLKRL